MEPRFREKMPNAAFCAWGRAAEKSTPLSEESLAAYFEAFALPTDAPLSVAARATVVHHLPQVPTGDLLETGGDAVEQSVLRELEVPMERRRQVDDRAYRIARDAMECTGWDKDGGDTRAGAKLRDLLSEFPAIAPQLADPSAPAWTFFDVCGAPGAWSRALLDAYPGARGRGVSLRDGPPWDLPPSERWAPVWGGDGTGDILSAANADALAQEVIEAIGRVDLCCADGAAPVDWALNEE